MKSLGKKIAVVGVSASGKSIFSRKLAEKTNLPLTHIDSIMWEPGWDYIGDIATVDKLLQVSSQSEWIIEGYIEKAARLAVFDRADQIIYLDYPGYISAWRYIKRWWKHRTNARPELVGSPEKFSLKFLKLVWTKGEVTSLDKFLDEHVNLDKILKLVSPKDARIFLTNLLAPHSNGWKISYQKESGLIKAIFGSSLVDIQHIGSTSVPDLLSKPIIDIAVQIASHIDADKFIEPLRALGYNYKPELSSPERHFFQKGDPIQFHLSIAYLDRGGYWQRQIAFRDYLVNHEEARREYEQVKLNSIDKSEFVQKVLALAESK